MKPLISLYESPGLQRMYHGSPYTGITDFSTVRPPIYFSPDRDVAEAYATRQMLGAAQRNRGNYEKGPTLYTVDCIGLELFDMREQGMKELYTQMRRDVMRGKNPDWDEDDYSDLKKAEPGELLDRSGLPQWSTEHGIWKLIKPLDKYDGVWIDEGSQGISCAVFSGLEKIKLVSVERLDKEFASF